MFGEMVGDDYVSVVPLQKCLGRSTGISGRADEDLPDFIVAIQESHLNLVYCALALRLVLSWVCAAVG